VEISGSLEDLGKWDFAKTRRMFYKPELQFWELQLNVPMGQRFEYKYLVKDDFGNITQWEFGDQNRSFSVDECAQIELRDFWRERKTSMSASVSWLFNRSSAFTDAIFGRSNRDPDAKVYKTAPKVPKDLDDLVVQFRLRVMITRTQSVYLCGSAPELGDWAPSSALRLECDSVSGYPNWAGDVRLRQRDFPLEYKYIIRDDHSGEVTWESGPNRVCGLSPDREVDLIFQNDDEFRGDKPVRLAGVAIPVFSIRTHNSLGVGEFSDIKLMVDWAASTGSKFLQLLPVNDTCVHGMWWDSYPYSSLSVFALHPLYIHLDSLKPAEPIKAEIMKHKHRLSQGHVQYEEVMRVKMDLLRRIFAEKKHTFIASKEFHQFMHENKEWLAPYALFCVLRDREGTSNFHSWKKYSIISPAEVEAMTASTSDLYGEISFHYFVQFHLSRQLSEASQYAAQHGVALKGDLPIGVDPWSVDTWYYPHLFRLTKQTGAPPDPFSATGQNWGFPTYDWEAMAREGYGWWKRRLHLMAKYFHAYRIDHILGFFRIWEIPSHGVSGMMGKFYPCIPIYRNELEEKGIWDIKRLVVPHIRVHHLVEMFGSENVSKIVKRFFNEEPKWVYELKEEFNTEQKIQNCDAEDWVKEKLPSLLQNAILIPEETAPFQQFHFRIDMHKSRSFAELPNWQRDRLYELYVDYFYRRQDDEWAKKALEKLPMMQQTTNMLVCGEDLGMIPACVQGVLDALSILGLRIQRMPKNPKADFDDPRTYPYLTVATPSVHDTSTIRGFWEEDRAVTQKFFNHMLGQHGEAPPYCEPWIADLILRQHLESPSMIVIIPMQDLLATQADTRLTANPADERVNIPAVRHHLWKYRMPLAVEELMHKHPRLAQHIHAMVKDAGRC